MSSELKFENHNIPEEAKHKEKVKLTDLLIRINLKTRIINIILKFKS